MVVQPLPPKEANLFKLIVKAYETKQYKKGLKAADQILKKVPEHGETLSMKGLILNCLNRKTEAYDLVRRGIKYDLKSHVSWHVYGLLYRSDREYREAIKCYRNALRIDPENIQILRDLSLLQAQMRDCAGFVETRRQLLTLKPNQRNNWIGFALSQHINSNPGMAVQIVESFEGTLEEDSSASTERYEISEMLLYKAMLLEEAGRPQDALNELDSQEERIVDKLSLKEQRAALLLELHRPAESEKVYRSLLDLNPDHYGYYKGLQACQGLGAGEGGIYSPSKVAMLAKLYTDLQQRFPHSSAAKRIPLDFLDGEAFEEALDKYVRPLLRKGVPSIFTDLKPLYTQPGKADLVEGVFTRLESALKETGNFAPAKGEDSPPQEKEGTLLWLLYFLAQHYDRRRLPLKALGKIDEALHLSPDVMDLYVVKARIMKHVGDPVAASALAEEARSLDLADRFLNSEAVKRMLQADQVSQAEKTAGLFTKDGEQPNNLFDMQCMWYELASGDSYLRQGALGKALKKYLATNKHYNDMVEDQFDFHTYCLRKMTLRAYVKMLRFEDNLHAHRFFCRGAQGAIRCYLALHETPQKTPAEEEEAAMAAMTPADRKKLRQKQRKAEARAKKEAEEKAKEEEEEKAAMAAQAAAKGPAKKAAPAAKVVDTDPDGAKLAQVEHPLVEAGKYIALLQAHAPLDLQTHLLAFDVFLRRQKLLLALQALKRQLRLAPQNPKVHCCLVRFFHTVDGLPAASTEEDKLVRSVIQAERAEIGVLGPAGEAKLQDVNEAFLREHSESLPHRAAVAEVLALLAPGESALAVAILEQAQEQPAQRGGVAAEGAGNWELLDCVKVHQLLWGPLQDEAAATRWQERCAARFPFSSFFKGAQSSAIVGPPKLNSLANGTKNDNAESASLDKEKATSGTPVANGVNSKDH